jgi:hypothetical protein
VGCDDVWPGGYVPMFRVNVRPPSYAVAVEAASSSEVSLHIYQTSVSYILEESPIHNYFCENVLYHSVKDSSPVS